jgi:hypothetical protein
LRQQADEEDKIIAQWRNDLKELEKKQKVKDAFLMKRKIEEEESKAKRLHDKAARRYFHGMLPAYLCS